MIRIKPSLAASAIAAIALQFAVTAQAPPVGQKVAAAGSLQELLRNVEQVRADDNKKFEDRKKDFDGIPQAQQAAKMKEAQDNRDGLDKAS